MGIVDKIVSEKLAVNVFAASHIANGLKLADLKTEEEQLARVRLYREWRKRGENTGAAYERAIKGEEPLPELFEAEDDSADYGDAEQKNFD